MLYKICRVRDVGVGVGGGEGARRWVSFVELCHFSSLLLEISLPE